jgi:hypothetical protein
MSIAQVFGRAWLYDEEPNEIQVWEHTIYPMKPLHRSGAEWCLEHLQQCYSDKDLRELLKVPETGNFQVIFKGTIEGSYVGYFDQEWEDQFDLEESQSEPIPDEWMNFISDDPKRSAPMPANGLIDQLVSFEDWHDGDVTHVMVGPATFKQDFGPWHQGETVDCLILDYARGFIEQQNDEGEVINKVAVKLTVK